MGNHAAVPYLVDEGVKLKSNFSSSIPLPEQVDSMDDLVTSSENKRFLLLNLDSFYLASSLLEEANESLLRRGLRSFQSLSTEEMEQLKQHYANLQNCALSGVKVRTRL
ncbi:hypothetical protein EON65_04935 [archaeon]|nr:MAG: hypothetical protein EON65_04935 [archaeon]